jgi:hypothetical protein
MQLVSRPVPGIAVLALVFLAVSGFVKAQTWTSPQFVTSGNAVALATNGKGTSAILFWETGPGLEATVGINGVWSSPITLSTATSVGSVAVAPNGDVLAVWSFHTNNTTTPIESQAAFYSGGHWDKTITITTSGSATASSSLADLVGLGFDGTSEATLVWEQLTGSGSCALEAVTGNAASGFGTPQVLGSTCLGWVQLAENNNGEALAVQGGATLEVAPIIGTNRAANGVWSASFDVAARYYGRQRPWVGLGLNGNAVVVWRARTFGEYAIEENGKWAAPVELPGSTGSVYPTVAMDSSGNAVAAYAGKVSSRPAGGAFQTTITLGSGEVVASPAGTFVVNGTSVATRLPGSTAWTVNGPSSGLVAIGPGQAIAVVNPSISVETENVP